MKARKTYKVNDEIVGRYYEFLKELFGMLSKDRFRKVQFYKTMCKYKTNNNLAKMLIEFGWLERIGKNPFFKYKIATDHEPSRKWAITVLKEISERNHANLCKIKEIETKEIIAPYKPSITMAQKDFYNTLIPFVGKYGESMIREFYDYWSEPNRSNTKMKCQQKETFDLSRRLARWYRNDYNNISFKADTVKLPSRDEPVVPELSTDNTELLTALSDIRKELEQLKTSQQPKEKKNIFVRYFEKRKLKRVLRLRKKLKSLENK